MSGSAIYNKEQCCLALVGTAQKDWQTTGTWQLQWQLADHFENVGDTWTEAAKEGDELWSIFEDPRLCDFGVHKHRCDNF